MLSVAEKQEIVKNAEIFSTVLPEYREMIAQRMGEKQFADGSFLFREGDVGDCLMIIHRGEVEIIKGENTVLAVLGEGDVLGEMAPLAGGKRSTSARAKKEVLALFLKGDALRLLIHKLPDIAIGLMRVLIERLQAANNKIQNLGALKSKEENGKYLLKIANGTQQGQAIVVPENLVIGRGNPAEKLPGRLNLKCGEKPSISRRHTEIFMKSGHYFIKDLGSVNGTKINGTLLEGIVSLYSGDKIEIGEVMTVFHQQ